MEIERKYLLDKLPFDLSPYKKIEIEQGYISSNPTIRIRKSGDGYFLTVKGSGMMVREEFEMSLTEEQFQDLWQRTESGTICKTRYLIPVQDGLTAELDVYHKQLRPLLTVEIEFESVDQAERFIPPDWFGRDVTFEQAYKNGHLAKHGLPVVE